MLIVVRIWLNRELFGRRLWPADVAWNRSPNGWTPAMPSRYVSSDSTSFSVMFLVFSSHRPSSARLYASSQREGSFVSERVDRIPRFPGLLCVFDGSGRHPLHRYRQRCSLKTSSFTILARKVSIESASALSDIFARMVRTELSICRRTSSSTSFCRRQSDRAAVCSGTQCGWIPLTQALSGRLTAVNTDQCAW